MDTLGSGGFEAYTCSLRPLSLDNHHLILRTINQLMPICLAIVDLSFCPPVKTYMYHVYMDEHSLLPKRQQLTERTLKKFKACR